MLHDPSYKHTCTHRKPLQMHKHSHLQVSEEQETMITAFTLSPLNTSETSAINIYFFCD